MKWMAAVINFGERKRSKEDGESFNKIKFTEYEVGDNKFFVRNLDDSVKMENLFKFKNYYLLADIRIDNRGQLRNLIDLNLKKNISDEMLLLHLIDRLGIDAIKHILGEFSFILWDSHKREVFAGRDHLGLKTLFWKRESEKLIIATDIELIMKVLPKKPELNKEYFKSFYCNNGFVDSEVTPFQNVFRVSCASWIVLNKEYTQTKIYWDLRDLKKEIRYRKQSEYEEHFLQLFENAVSYRLKAGEKNAIMMSGGLDSTSVFAMAKKIQKEKNNSIEIVPVCGVFNKYSDCDEREYINLVLKMYKSDSHNVVCDEYGVFKNFPNDSPFTYEPFVNSSSHAFVNALVQRCSSAGAKNILTGYAADHFIGGTELIIADYIKQFKWKKAIKHSLSYARLSRLSVLNILLHSGIIPVLRRRKTDVEKLSISFDQAEFLKQKEATLARIYSDRIIVPQNNLTIAHPFLDRSLIEFLFSIPGEYKWAHGIKKVLLRKAMDKLLPKEILARLNKTTHTSLTLNEFKNEWPKIFSNIRQKSHISEMGFMEETNWMRILTLASNGYISRDDFWILITLEIWFYKKESINLV